MLAGKRGNKLAAICQQARTARPTIPNPMIPNPMGIHPNRLYPPTGPILAAFHYAFQLLSCDGTPPLVASAGFIYSLLKKSPLNTLSSGSATFRTGIAAVLIVTQPILNVILNLKLILLILSSVK